MEPVVIDCGTASIRAGYANPDNDPSIVFPSALRKINEEANGTIHWPKNGSTDGNVLGSDLFPIERGLIKDWDIMEDAWRYIFYSQIGWEIGSEGQVLVAEPLCNPKGSRERMVQLMFEEFNVLGFYAMEQVLLSLYAVGRLTGCSVDVGHGKIDIAPIVEGALQHSAVRRVELGGQDLDSFLGRQLAVCQPQSSLDTAALRHLKEALCSVPLDSETYEMEEKDCEPVKHTLPDGQVISVGRERFTVGEALFRPSLLDIEDFGLPEQVARCVALCGPIETQKQVMDSVVLTGGTSLMQGFEARFMKEATLSLPPSLRPTLAKPPDYMPENTAAHSAWIGGAILAKVVFPQNQHISKGDYDETGPTIVHKKCS